MANDQSLEVKEIVKRLDAILNVLLESSPAEGKKLPMSRRVQLLYQAGLRPSEIARILGKTPTYVTVELTRIKSKLATK
jgi:hypothetical protein